MSFFLFAALLFKHGSSQTIHSLISTMISSLPSKEQLVVDTIKNQLAEVGTGGKVAYYIPAAKCYECLTIRVITNGDWAFETEVLTHALSVRCKNYINGICIFDKGKPKVFTPTTGWKIKALLQPWNEMKLNPKLTDFCNNDSFNGIAITSGDVAQYCGLLIEAYIGVLKSQSEKAGQLSLWDDPEFVRKQRRHAAEVLEIPIVQASEKAVWGLGFEVFHCTCGINHNQGIKFFKRIWEKLQWTPKHVKRCINRYRMLLKFVKLFNISQIWMHVVCSCIL